VRDEQTLDDRSGRGYESRILETATLAVRPGNWHDVFNVLVWRTFPCAKATLNECHCVAFEQHLGPARGPVRDALTLLDESGVIVVASDGSLLDALRRFRWKELFWWRRAELGQCLRMWVFGHALYEKLLRPYLGLTGHAVLFSLPQAAIEAPPAEQITVLDRELGAFLRDGAALQSPQDLHPVPLLGMPGWHPGTADESFYDNAAYFRPGRTLRSAARE
jgi:hypothetical protein